MPPSKIACKTLATGLKVSGEIAVKLVEIYNAVAALFKAKAAAKYGLLDIANVVGTQIISAISSVAAQIANNIMGDISKAASALLERIFSAILKILLSFPTAIFSLVAIPHDAALKATRREGLYLSRAQKNLTIVLGIILKWTDGKSGTEYYNQMKNALPFITKAIELTKDLILGLQGEPIRGDWSSNNSVFKKGVYRSIKVNLNNAISISKPESLIEERFNINALLEESKREKYNEKAAVINDTYGRRRKRLSDGYQKNMQNANPSGSRVSRLADATKQHKIGLKYSSDLANLSTWKEIQLAAARTAAEVEALADMDVWTKALDNTANLFMTDMRTLGDQLYEMSGNIKDAYVANKQSQLYCNNVYNIKHLITGIIATMIDYLRGIGNAAGKKLALTIAGAQSLMEVAEDTFTEAVEPGNRNSYKLASSLSLGHGSLLASDAILDSVVTDSLVELINSDDVLQAEDDEFDEFHTELGKIPDWDGKAFVWSVNMAEGATSPYIQLISDITEMLQKVPGLSVMGREDDKARARKLIKDANNTFKVLHRHNSIVGNTLSSYTPYVGSDGGDLMKILSNAGLLGEFAAGMSIASLVLAIGANYKDFFGDEWPTVENCKASYPEYFTEIDAIIKGFSNKSLNMSDPVLDNSSQEKLEKNSNDRQIQWAAARLSNTNFSETAGTGNNKTIGSDSQDTEQDASPYT